MVQGPTQLFLEMSMQTRVNIAAPRSHDQPLQRRQAHGRFDALTAENRTSAAAIAEMDADERAHSPLAPLRIDGSCRESHSDECCVRRTGYTESRRGRPAAATFGERRYQRPLPAAAPGRAAARFGFPLCWRDCAAVPDDCNFRW